MANTLVANMEKEIDRLKRQSETMKLRRSLARGEAKIEGPTTAGGDRRLREQMAPERSEIIHVDPGRLQTIKSRPSTLAPDNMSYEDLEELKVTCAFDLLAEAPGETRRY